MATSNNVGLRNKNSTKIYCNIIRVYNFLLENKNEEFKALDIERNLNIKRESLNEIIVLMCKINVITHINGSMPKYDTKYRINKNIINL